MVTGRACRHARAGNRRRGMTQGGSAAQVEAPVPSRESWHRTMTANRESSKQWRVSR
jgi:hypothetical protein